MGGVESSNTKIPENADRKAFITLKSFAVIPGSFGTFAIYTFVIRYQRYKWEITIRYHELLKFQRTLMNTYAKEVIKFDKLPRYNKLFFTHDRRFLDDRSRLMLKVMQEMLDIRDILNFPTAQIFFGASAVSFNPDYGWKGKEGYLKKSSGGYVEKFSRKTGDYITLWKWRWVVLHSNCITWYKDPKSQEPQGCIQIDKEFGVVAVNRVITLQTGTRKLAFYAETSRSAREWVEAMESMYKFRARKEFFDASYPPRMKNDVRVYTNGKEYFQNLAISLLSAQKEILITSWKNSPTVLLTRPPLPPLRLDQILKYKADQGVKIFVLLYKEVEGIGQGNDSYNVMSKLEKLSPNIKCIRHPNKFIGGATAVLWSHHEKLAIIDR
jgi:hypothetical protein